MENRSKAKIAHTLQAINIIPIIVFGMLVLLLGTKLFTASIFSVVETELKEVAANVMFIYDLSYPGDYHLEGDESLKLYKGDTDITNDYSVIDYIKAQTDLDITIFYQDTRILTTVYDANDVRIVGSGAPEKVVNKVLYGGEDLFLEKILIVNSPLCGYYTPIKNSDGTIAGMLFVGKSTATINKAIHKSVTPLLFATLVALVLILVFINLYTKQLFAALSKLHIFFNKVSSGDMNAELDKSVQSRNDEFGDIGKSALSMQRALRSMVETDPLTELANRRCAHRKIAQILKNKEEKDLPFSICIGDIDFFKKVNDTYGHVCGDVVLKKVADTLRNFMREYGFVARWGGEEFLLVFDHSNLSEAHDLLEKLLKEICALEIEYEDQIVRISMTFGVTEGHTNDTSVLFNEADEKLYRGKMNGRCQVVSEP